MGNVMIVTGGGRGIGAAIARQAAAHGWDVAIGYQGNDAAAAEVVDACRQQGQRAIAIKGDVSIEDDVVELFARTGRELGHPTALVNNAGIVSPKASFEAYSDQRIRRVFEVNVIGAFLCAREAVKLMSGAENGGGGVIINIGSAASYLGSANEYIDYAASKGAIDSMTVGLAKEVAAQGIRVNCVRPGLIDTEIHASGGQPERLRQLAPTIPMQREGAPDEVANLVMWLVSPQASYVTGALMNVSGGR